MKVRNLFETLVCLTDEWFAVNIRKVIFFFIMIFLSTKQKHPGNVLPDEDGTCLRTLFRGGLHVCQKKIGEVPKDFFVGKKQKKTNDFQRKAWHFSDVPKGPFRAFFHIFPYRTGTDFRNFQNL